MRSHFSLFQLSYFLDYAPALSAVVKFPFSLLSYFHRLRRKATAPFLTRWIGPRKRSARARTAKERRQQVATPQIGRSLPQKRTQRVRVRIHNTPSTREKGKTTLTNHPNPSRFGKESQSAFERESAARQTTRQRGAGCAPGRAWSAEGLHNQGISLQGEKKKCTLHFERS